MERLDATFSALADPTRRAILARLILGEASVTELAQPFAMSQPAISKHLKVLERAGLVARGREAQRRPVRLVAKPLAEAVGWLEGYRRFWEESYSRLDHVLEELKTDARSAAKRPSADAAKSGKTTPARRRGVKTGARRKGASEPNER
jgi:DNA-binding transcriptional ArsR family regulator